MDAIHTLEPYSEHSDVPARAVLRRRQADAAHHSNPINLPVGQPMGHRIDDADNLLSARSVLISVVIGAGLWAVMIAAGWLIFR